MKRQREFPHRFGAVLGTLCGLLLVASPVHAGDHSASFTEEFHHTYPLSTDGRVDLDNINGSVHITAWDRNEVKVDAVKYAGSQERLDEAKIQVNADASSVSIHTEYHQRDDNSNYRGWDNPASVEYTLTVPRGARLDEIKLINGELDVEGTTGEVRASCINGRLNAERLSGRLDLSTINGRLEVVLDQLANSPIDLSSVNGSVALTLASDTKARLEASTVHGGIRNDFGLHVHNHQWVGHDMSGELGGGGNRIKLSNVNGSIEVRHASDGHAMSPSKDLNGSHDEDDDSI